MSGRGGDAPPHRPPGRGGGGIKALLLYFEKTLRSKAASIQDAETERARNQQIGLAVQREIAKKRLRGVRQSKGDGPRRTGRASLDDIGAEVFGNEPQEA